MWVGVHAEWFAVVGPPRGVCAFVRLCALLCACVRLCVVGVACICGLVACNLCPCTPSPWYPWRAGPLPQGATVTLHATGPDGPITWPFHVALSVDGADGSTPDGSAVHAPEVGAGGGVVLTSAHRCSGRLVHTAAARARIRDLEQSGDVGRNDGVALAVRCALGTAGTSM